MVKYSKNDTIDVEKYAERINRNQYILYDKDAMGMYQRELSSKSSAMLSMFTDLMIQKSHGRLRITTKDCIIKYLIDYEFCPYHYFTSRKTQSLSLDMKKVLGPLMQNGYATEFLAYYTGYKSLKSRSERAASLIKNTPAPEIADRNGKMLAKLGYTARQQVNLRFNYSNHDVIAQIPKEISKCIGVEDGYFLAWGDFAQSDFRIAYNLFLRSKENDEIMNKYDDKYEALARIISNKLGEKFDKEKFLEQRQVYKKNTLAVMYGTRNSVIEEDKGFISMFSNFLSMCPRYVEYYNRLNDAHDLGLPVALTSYFGYEESSPIQYKKTDTVNRALNAPIQTGTSEMIIRTVNEILDRFYRLGYTEDDISIYLVRHDEPVFKISKRVLKDIWILEDFSTIFVDDWSPLAMSFELGYNYGIADEELMTKFKDSVRQNKSKIGVVEPEPFSDSVYYPTKKVAKWYVACMAVYDKTIVAFYDEDRNLAHSTVVFSNVPEEVSIAIQQMIHDCKFDDEYRGIIIYNSLVDTEDFSNGTYLSYVKMSGTQFLKVSSLCRYAVCCYCKANGLESVTEPPISSMEEFIKSVKKIPEFQA
jgi:hypothetical protein